MDILKSRHRQLARAVRILAAAAVLAPVFIFAQARADVNVQGFNSSGTLQPGWVVALDKTASKTVKAAPANDTNQIYGVAIDPSDAPFTLSSQNAQVFVATSGSYNVLVSTANGPIKAGDYISMSPINGIAGKATIAQSTVLGRAEAAFNGSRGVITGSGDSAIGRISVDISVQHNPLAADQAVPTFLKKISNSVAGRQVPVARVYAALAIFIAALLCALVILYVGVRSSMVALGRNPLSRHTIFSGMYKVIFTGLGIFILGLAGVYLLLRV